MPLEVNGYSATFKAFADFAEQSVRDGAGKTIADARVKRTLDGRKIVDLTKAVGDSVHKWTRGGRAVFCQRQDAQALQERRD